MNIYVDASYCAETGNAGIGIPYKNISKRIKAKGSLAAELIAVIVGAQHANNNDVIITDCKVIVEANKTKRLLMRHEELCANLYKILKAKCLSVQWVKREKNKKADSLARKARRNT